MMWLESPRQCEMARQACKAQGVLKGLMVFCMLNVNNLQEEQKKTPSYIVPKDTYLEESQNVQVSKFQSTQNIILKLNFLYRKNNMRNIYLIKVCIADI